MENSSLFTQVVQSLDQNEDSARIKKLVFYVAKQVWARDQNQLDSISLTDLVRELFTIYSDIESLKKNIYRMAQTLNKPEQYLSVASTIIAEAKILYDFQKNKLSFESDLITVPLVTAVRQEALVTLAPTSPSVQTKKKVEPFEIRLKVMTQTNPLQAKILLFSVVEHQFDWSQQDWAALRSTELYELIRNITYTCQSFEVLVDTLNLTARKLNKPHEYLAIANIISQALKPMF
ncbi:hypothetical protein [Scytonema millei]|uniref:Uncharacterized protein n=1 Tax=Scytonema millei VB511283 TaxID=1245923 RepID=A0A9X5I5G3_9CYAN|nr:hypothetical protein [Scytonema millei]NHC35639.1 hypothetical protein [Scytonema millei VB511283]